MITYADFLLIDGEVKAGIEEVLNFIKTHSTHYILLLANGEYIQQYDYQGRRFSPYVIDSREDRHKDQDRTSFLMDFVNSNYSFPNGGDTVDNGLAIHLELMIYTHIWESKPFLKQLYRLATLVQRKSYTWDVQVPEMNKHKFIRNDIRSTIAPHCPLFAQVITKGFFSSLRNAFAHSEYHFNKYTNHIILDTYKGDKWDMKEISYNDWTRRFVYSALLTYHLQNALYTHRASLHNEFGTDDFVIIHPIASNRFRALWITYDSHYDTFNFKR